ncbi:MAG: ABC transporter permease [Candidatus Margulisiibacteriota bacterium]
MALIQLSGISKTYAIGKDIAVKALKSIDLKIEQGEFVALMGPSGSGKSTLLAILGMLDRSDGGSYKLNGKEISTLPDHEAAMLRNRFFGFIFQSFNLLPRLDILTNVLLPFIYSPEGITQKSRQKVASLMERVGLADRLRHSPTEISGGQQQRVAVVRAIANDPLVILADEPTGNLDSKSTEDIINMLVELNKNGNTIVMVTHNPDLAKYATRVLLLKDGQIVDDKIQSEVKPGKSVYNTEFGKKKNGLNISPDSIKNYVKEALLSLKANKLRSFLSIIGVMIGVAAVIAMLAIGTGAKEQVEKSLSNLGTNLLMVSTSRRSGGISLGSDSATRFNFDDLAALKNIEGVKNAIPYVNGNAQAVYGGRNWRTSIVGTETEYQVIKDSFPTNGRFFTKAEVTTRAKVAIIGSNVAKELFLEENPVGKNIRINRINFQVIGVLPEKGSAGFQNMDDQIIVPVTTAMYRLIGTDYINRFDVQAENPEVMSAVESAIPLTLGKLHRLQQDQYDQIDIRNMADIQKAMNETIQTLSYLLGSIAAVSLLVGGIGIMNIMLVIVMERTREIGLRKALGAQNSDIMTQFLVEGTLICLIGGIIGILFGASIAMTMSTIFGWNTLVSGGSIILAFGFSIFTGIVFSLWPARRAARLLPIEALRYE